MYLRKHWAIVAIYFLLLFTFSTAASTPLLVLYPKVSAPYSQIFDEIIVGIEHQFKGDVILKSIKKSDSTKVLSTWIDNKNPQMLIALGRRSYKLIRSIENEKPVVIGALPIKPNGMPGASLLAAPKVYLAHCNSSHLILSVCMWCIAKIASGWCNWPKIKV
ncbi:MAG: hypothetical protein JKY14_05245 [Paraglaciecola sp.]|nr:hypothetical protein [Paraglaciecola sp.]